MTLRRITLALFLAIALLAPVLASAQAPDLPGRFPTGTSQEVAATIVALEERTGFDGPRDLLTAPYSTTTVQALAEAVDHPAPQVRETALRLLALTVRQLDPPSEDLHQVILPAVRRDLATVDPAAGPQAERTAELARRVVWHAEIGALDHEGQRLEALAAALDDRTDGYYYPIAALDYLADLATEGTRELLEEKIAESERRSVSPKLMQRVRTTGVKVDLRIRMRELAPEAQVELLNEALVASLPDHSQPARDLQAWIVRRIGERDGTAAERVLDSLAGDETIRADLRYEAERALGDPGPRRPELPERR